MKAGDNQNGQIPLILIHGAWKSARSWENYVGTLTLAEFRYAFVNTFSEEDAAGAIDSWLDGVLDARVDASNQA